MARVMELWVEHSELKFQKTFFICLQTPFSMLETAEGQLADALSCCTLIHETGAHGFVTSVDTCEPGVSCWRRPPSQGWAGWPCLGIGLALQESSFAEGACFWVLLPF